MLFKRVGAANVYGQTRAGSSPPPAASRSRSASLGTPALTPDWAGFMPATSSPAARWPRMSAAATSVFPTPVSVPVTNSPRIAPLLRTSPRPPEGLLPRARVHPAVDSAPATWFAGTEPRLRAPALTHVLEIAPLLGSPVTVALVEAAWIVGMGSWLLLERRPPAATLAWILALAFMPLVGIPVYLLLGPRRLERKRLRMALVPASVFRLQYPAREALMEVHGVN